MNILVVSDLHIDKNKTKDFGFLKHLSEVDLILIAGDIADNAIEEVNFLNSIDFDKPIICVPGNHLGYDYGKINDYKDLFYEGTLEEQIAYCQNNTNSNIHYINNDEIIYYKDFVIFGGCMYSDFKLYNNEFFDMKRACLEINDFTLVKTQTIDNEIKTITPLDYQNYYNKFKINLLKILKEHRNKNIIILTHFLPCELSIASKYKNKTTKGLNPYYCSDMSDIILDNKNIKLWVHGHTHNTFDYMLEDCRIVCYPYGRMKEHALSPKKYKGKIISL